MAIVILDAVILAASPALVGTAVPAGYNRKFTHAVAFNSTAGLLTLKLFVCASGQTGDDTRQICSQDIEPKESYLCPELISAQVGPAGTLECAGDGLSFSFVAEDTPAN